jgi:hypothetical protein
MGGRFGLLVVCALLSSKSASAQNDPVFDEARRSFESGVEHLERGDAAAAIERFERSLALRESLAALYNLGLAYRKAGRIKDGLLTFERFLDKASQQSHTHGVDHAKLLADELRGKVGRISLAVSGGADSVKLDGNAIGDGDGRYGLVLDPGSHVVEASRGANEPERVQVELEPGANIEVAVEIQPELMLVPVAVAPAPVEVPPAEPLVEQWWFWTVIGVVAAGAAVGIIVAARPSEPEYDRGTNDVLLRALEAR